MTRYEKVKTVIVLLALAAITGFALFQALVAAIPPCEYEDGCSQIICLWNAQTSGNGVGTSFLALLWGHVVVYP